MRPIAIPTYINQTFQNTINQTELITIIKTNYKNLHSVQPVISVVIPAFNEEKNILPTLLSLTSNKTQFPIEIIVVNNNSSDQTEFLVNATEINCVKENTQGITVARNTGLANAKGQIILNADADTIYPISWIEQMSSPLIKNEKIAMVYGRFSFIPIGKTGRLMYFFYEYTADFMRWINKIFRDEAMNTYGFNSGFRKAQGLAVDGFNHPPGTNEDGWLALKLRNKGFGKLHYVTNISALVWTTDRRIQIDGGLWKGALKRLKRMLDI